MAPARFVTMEADGLCRNKGVVTSGLGSGHGMTIWAGQLPLADHVHGLDAGDDLGRRPERLEAQHGPGAPLDGSVVLFDKVVQVLRLAQLDAHPAVVDQALHGRGVGATLVSRPGESHPQPLAEPDVSLSTHPAPIIQPGPQPDASGRTDEGMRP